MPHQPASSLPDTLQDVACHSDHSAALGMELVTLATTQAMEMEIQDTTQVMEMETLATIQAMEAHGEMETPDIIQDMEMETPGTAMEILATILALEVMKTLVITLEMSPAMLVRKRRITLDSTQEIKMETQALTLDMEMETCSLPCLVEDHATMCVEQGTCVEAMEMEIQVIILEMGTAMEMETAMGMEILDIIQEMEMVMATVPADPDQCAEPGAMCSLCVQETSGTMQTMGTATLVDRGLVAGVTTLDTMEDTIPASMFLLRMDSWV